MGRDITSTRGRVGYGGDTGCSGACGSTHGAVGRTRLLHRDPLVVPLGEENPRAGSRARLDSPPGCTECCLFALFGGRVVDATVHPARRHSAEWSASRCTPAAGCPLQFSFLPRRAGEHLSAATLPSPCLFQTGVWVPSTTSTTDDDAGEGQVCRSHRRVAECRARHRVDVSTAGRRPRCVCALPAQPLHAHAAARPLAPRKARRPMAVFPR